MNKPKALFLAIALCIYASACFAADIRLTLKEPIDGKRYLTGEKVELSRDAVVLKIDGEVVSIKRNDIDSIKFLPTRKADATAPEKSSQKNSSEETALETKSQQAKSKAVEPSSEPEEINLKDLQSPENTKKFLLIQEEMMDKYKGRDNYDAAIRKQNELYGKLANGSMSIEELKAEAARTSAHAKEYDAYETHEYPELPMMLQLLDNFSAQ